VKVGDHVTLAATVDNIAGFWMPAFALVADILDENGFQVAADTVHYTPVIDKNGVESRLIFVDSLFIAQNPGIYTINARVYWDLNNDTLINDPPDANPGNDHFSINRTVSYTILYTTISMIQNVPDLNQPPTLLLPSTVPINYCAPFATANITSYWDVVVGHANAQGVNGGFPGETVAEYIGWFMDTNDSGNPLANNGTALYPTMTGTYTVDQDSFLTDYIRWDLAHPYPGAPSLPASKMGFDWQFNSDYQTGFSFYQQEIDSLRPVKVDFIHWNIIFDNTLFVDTLTLDTVYVYKWGSMVPYSAMVDPEAPEETWNLDENPSGNIGHAVSGVGYTVYGQTNPNYAIVHDNWQTTHKDIAIPWAYWNASIGMDPTLISTAIEPENNVVRKFHLEQNYPNPFNPKTIINYEIPITNYVDLSIYNLLGQKVATLVDEEQNAGTYQVEWDASGFSSGIYLYKITAGEFQAVKKMVLLR
jgi:hypothetical protein